VKREVFLTFDYYKKGERLIKSRDAERAIDAFVSGLERGDPKCAFGIYYTVAIVGSVTMTIYEAENIFNERYDEIRDLADMGDAEAMVILAESARYGFSDADEEPYMLRLYAAAALGSEKAKAIIADIKAEDEERISLPEADESISLAEAEEQAIVPPASELPIGLTDSRAKELCKDISRECILIADEADGDILESLGMLPGSGKVYSGFDDGAR
jgi:hypothetical protein